MSLAEVGAREVAKAVDESRELGRLEFLSRYGFGRATTYLLKVDGRLYDPKAIVGVAHRYTTSAAALSPDEFDATGAIDRLRTLGFDVVRFSRLWWVNQGTSYQVARDEGSIWAPQKTRAGHGVGHHTDVATLRVGDRLIHYANNQIRAVGSVASQPVVAPRPPGHGNGGWGEQGYLCPVNYHEFAVPIDGVDIPHRDPDAGPFDVNGKVKQGYLFRISDDATIPMLEFLLQRDPDLFDPSITHRAATPGEQQSALGRLVSQFRTDTDYSVDRQAAREAEREELRPALTMSGLDEPMVEVFRRLAGSAYGSPGPQPGFYRLLQTPDGTAAVVSTLRHLLHGTGAIEQRLTECVSGEHKLQGVGEAMMVKALAVYDPSRWIPTYTTIGKASKGAVLDLLGERVPGDLPVGAAAAAANDKVRALLQPYLGDDPWGMQEFSWWLLHRDRVHDDPISDLAGELLLPAAFLTGVTERLADKPQVIFYGPPGTGKTYVARKLAGYLTRGGGTVETVQFHPSYTYEDFVEGYRPTLNEGQVSYEVVDGPLKRIAAAAQLRPDVTHVLLIDELNRANVAKVLGELLFLLEYRDEELLLQYSATPFSLPSNLIVLATMNTADRSIALVDAALRRRFHLVAFFPDTPPIAGLLRRWLKSTQPDLLWVADVVDRANGLLDIRESAIGPSHFMRPNLTGRLVDLIWESSILPLLEDHFYAAPEQLLRFSLTALRTEETATAYSLPTGTADTSISPSP